MTETTNGFVLAEEDLKMRGSGEILEPVNQEFQEFQVADLVEDYPILEEARKVASQIVATPVGENTQIGICSLFIWRSKNI